MIMHRVFHSIPVLLAAAVCLTVAGCSEPLEDTEALIQATGVETAPTAIIAHPTGSFQDDYNIRYDISDSTWTQFPGNRYRIVPATDSSQVLFLHQSATDSTEARWTRVDWMTFNDMEPWTWGFCYSAWDLPSMQAAESAEPADASTPMTGCGGFPFSRMQSAQ